MEPFARSVRLHGDSIPPNKAGRNMKRYVWIGVILLVAVGGAVGAVAMSRNGKAKDLGAVVKVERGDVVEKALAVGSIVPRDEISVKAKVSGVVKRVYREPGQYVAAGEPLLEIRPDPTPLELADARRRVDMDAIAFRNAEHDLGRARDLYHEGMIPDQELERAQKAYDETALQLEASRERQTLIEKGSVSIDGQEIDATVRAPISGSILEKMVNLGDPVVPLTSYQEGTVLMTMANMDSLIFKGTVDEIDVGKLSLGMPVEIKIGALPGQSVSGHLVTISLKAREENNTRMFPVEIAIADSRGALLRAGYSANADIIIRRADAALTLPERVVYSHNDSTWVEVPGTDGARIKTPITTGLSDAIHIEVTSGLSEGQDVLEKPEETL